MKYRLVFGALLVVFAAACARTGPLQIRDPKLPGSLKPQAQDEPSYNLDRRVADGRAYSAYLKSQFALMQGDLDAAVRYLKVATRRDPWATAPKMRLAGVLLMLNRSDEAGDVLAELSLDPESLPPELLRVYVSAVINTDERKAARGAVREAYRRQLLTPLQFLRWISIEETQTNAQGLLEFVRSLREIRDGEPVLDCVEGHLNVQLGDYETADMFLDRCLGEFTNWIPGMLEKGLVSELLGNDDTARAMYQHVLEAQPGQALATWRLRTMQQPKTQRREARKELQALLSEVRYETALQLASQAIGEDDIVRADTVLSNLPKAWQQRPRARILFGALAEIRGEYERALDLYLQAAEAQHAQVRRIAYMQWVRALAGGADGTDQWKAIARKQYEEKPDPALALAISLGLADEDREAAIAFLSERVQEHRDDAELHYRLGVFYEQSGSREQALEQMEAAIAVEPEHADALNFLGYSLAEAGRDLPRAEQLVRAALAAKPDAGYVMDSLGWVLFQQGKADEAIPWLEKALESEGPDPVILEHLGDAYAVTGRDEEAREAYREALRMVEDIDEAQRLRDKILRTRDTQD